jgi:hypothetical protein
MSKFIDSMIFTHNGTAIEAVEAAEYPVMAAGMIANNVVQVFKTQKAFDAWALSSCYSEQVKQVGKNIQAARQYEKADVAAIKRRQMKIIERISEDMTELAKRTKLDPASEELFLRATSKSDLLEGPVFDPLTAFDAVGTGGSIGAPGPFLHLPGGGWPDFRWFGWDNRISSVRISGVAVFFQNSWWSGRALWLGGFPVWYHGDLRIFGFDNMASSAWVA